MRWTLTDAKNRLSEVLDRAVGGEVQTITRRGDEFVLVKAERYRKLTGETTTLVDYLVGEGPRVDDTFDPRMPDTTPTRDPLTRDDGEAAA